MILRSRPAGPRTRDLALASRADLLHIFEDALAEASTHRAERPEWVPDPGVGGELGWVTYERDVMRDLTNQARSARGLPPVDERNLRRAESSAEGHIDYITKFAAHCADLALGASPWN